MLYAFIGTDTKTSQQKAQAFIAQLLKKEPFATQVQVTDETILSMQLDEFLQSAGLFKDKMIVRVSNLLTSAEHGASITALLPQFASTEHIVVLVDDALTKKQHDGLTKQATLVTSSESDAKQAKQSRNPFAITDALLARDGKTLFIELEQARLSGASAEEVIGILFWAVKAMVLTLTASTPADADLSPFVFKKAQAGVTVWGAAGAQNLMQRLAAIPHESRELGENTHDALARELLALCA